MISTIRTTAPMALNRRLFSISATTNAPSSSPRAAKIAAYTVLGSTVVIAGASRLLKDEVVYWTPNVR
ncbi:hypothetical protein BGZ65_003881, partial [Modicella reniformis]